MLIKIHCLCHPNFLGDKNQALGIQTELLALYPQMSQAKEWNVQDSQALAKLQEELKNKLDCLHIIISMGSHGLETLEKIKPRFQSNIVSVYASHQILPQLKDALQHIDILALPTHTLNENFHPEKTHPHLTLIPTLGVAHNLYVKDIHEAFQEWQKESKENITLSKHYLAVILGGDAPDASGQQRYFTKEESKILASYLAKIYKEKGNPKVLITNSPRTGKFNPHTGQEMKVHTGDIIDQTTSALLTELTGKDVPYQFFDFVSGKPSAYKAILGAAKQSQESMVFVTGDSTSMITEIGDNLNRDTVFVVQVNSMNETHLAHMKSVYTSGYTKALSLQTSQYTLMPEMKASHPEEVTRASTKIAKVIAKKIEAKQNFYKKTAKDLENYLQYGVISFRRQTGSWLESLLTLDASDKYILHQESKSIHQEILQPSPVSTSYIHLLPYIPNALYRGILLGLFAGSWEYNQTSSFGKAFIKGSIGTCLGFGTSLWLDSSKRNIEECFMRSKTIQAILSPPSEVTQTNSPNTK